MTFADTLQLAFRNLGEARLRTALTTLGVSIGIASLAGMVSLGVGLQDQFVGRFTRSGMFDAITVFGGQDRPGFLARGLGAGARGFGGGRGGRRSQGADPDRVLNDAALKQLAALPQVTDVYANLRVPLEVSHDQSSEGMVASGVPMSSRGEGAFQDLVTGRFFANDAEVACMLSLDFAKRVAADDPKALVGQSLTLTFASASATLPAGTAGPFQIPRESLLCPVIGIVERESAPGIGGVAVAPVMIPLGLAQKILDKAPQAARALAGQSGERSYPSLTIKVAKAQATQDVEDQVKKLGFFAFSLNDALQGAKRLFIIVDIVLSLIGSIALAVSSLGIANTMVMSILERTREIGIMKAIGASDGDIRRIFLIEASAIGLLGGVSGVALGWAVGRVINFGANIYIQNQGGTPGNLFSLPIWLIASAIGFSIVASLVAGTFPSARAARLDPIQALRHD
jgi:putative ABC transport system permease protein